tara:strand:+ start:433 stop:873 length:441 start_codon:yes stop_codon:yes gene_type:complete
MSHPQRDDGQTWDHFFDFVTDTDEQLTRNEVRSELKKFGVDPAPAIASVKAALEARRAQAKLAIAKEQRASMTTELFGVVSHSAEQVRDSIRSFIEERFQGSGQAAYFRKLDEAASDEDLQSLMDDLARLDALTQGNKPHDADETE